MTPNDLGKGARVQLRNGLEAELLDNRKGIRRLAEVYGHLGIERGTVYAADILYYMEPLGGRPLWVAYRQVKLEHTKNMLKARDACETILGGAA